MRKSSVPLAFRVHTGRSQLERPCRARISWLAGCGASMQATTAKCHSAGPAHRLVPSERAWPASRSAQRGRQRLQRSLVRLAIACRSQAGERCAQGSAAPCMLPAAERLHPICCTTGRAQTLRTRAAWPGWHRQRQPALASAPVRYPAAPMPAAAIFSTIKPGESDVTGLSPAAFRHSQGDGCSAKQACKHVKPTPSWIARSRNGTITRGSRKHRSSVRVCVGLRPSVHTPRRHWITADLVRESGCDSTLPAHRQPDFECLLVTVAVTDLSDGPGRLRADTESRSLAPPRPKWGAAARQSTSSLRRK